MLCKSVLNVYPIMFLYYLIYKFIMHRKIAHTKWRDVQLRLYQRYYQKRNLMTII
jgi:hypothetical protein